MLGLSSVDEASLGAIVDRAVALGLRGGGVLGRPPRDEPQAVIAVYSMLATLKPFWSQVFASYGAKVSMQGAFIHGKPHVSFNLAKTPPDCCELGDLLLVVDDTRRGRADRRAIIIQAKPVSGKRLHPTRPNERKQLDLNVNWPVFNFVTLGYGKTLYDFRDPKAPGSVSESSAYGAVDLARETWEQLVPSSSMIIGMGEPLSRTIVKMVVGAGGRQAELPATPATPCGDQWSETVRLLLEQSFGLVTGTTLGSTKRSFLNWIPWGDDVSETSLWIDSDCLDGDAGAPPPDIGSDDDGTPISIFRITITGSDDR